MDSEAQLWTKMGDSDYSFLSEIFIFLFLIIAETLHYYPVFAFMPAYKHLRRTFILQSELQRNQQRCEQPLTHV